MLFFLKLNWNTLEGKGKIIHSMKSTTVQTDINDAKLKRMLNSLSEWERIIIMLVIPNCINQSISHMNLTFNMTQYQFQCTDIKKKNEISCGVQTKNKKKSSSLSTQ